MPELLVLHDDEMVLERCSDRLANQFEVVVTRDPQEALGFVGEVDCVVVGRELSGWTGFGFVEEAVMHSDPGFVLFTDSLDEELVRGVAESGVDDYVQGYSADSFDALSRRVRGVLESDGGLDRYRALVENADDAMYALDSDGCFSMVNESYVELTGHTRDELMGQHPSEYMDEGEVERVEALIRELLVSDRNSDTIEIQVEDDGETTVYEENVIVVTDDDGVFHGTVGVLRDITDRKRREEELERYESMLNTVPDLVWALDSEGYVLAVNDAARDVFMEDTDVDEVVGMHASEWMTGEELTKGREIVKELLRDDDSDEGTYEIDLKVGEERVPGEVHMSLLTDDDGGFLGTAGVTRDVSDRKERERELEQYETFVQASGDGMYALDPEGRFTFVNEALIELLGYGEDEMLGSHASLVMDDEDVRRGEELIETLVQNREKEHGTFEMDAVTKQGGRVTVENHVAVLTDDDGFRGTVGVTRDISERKRRERKIREQRRQLEILNRIVRHDIRNDMNVVMGWTEMAADHVDEEGGDYLDRVLEITDGVVETTESVKQLMEAITTGEVDLEPTDVGEVVWSEVRKARLSHDDAEFVVGDVPDVAVMANQMLSAVINNLLNNAVRHNDREKPRVEVGVEDFGDSVVVGVADDGPGVPDDRKEEVFGRDEKGLESPGTGIGLYLVDSLVDQFGGEVWIEDNEPRGAVFKVRLRKTDA